MAEDKDTPNVQNKRLLLVALLLGVITAIIYNVHISRVRNEGRGTMVTVLRVTNDVDANEVIGATNLEEVELPIGIVQALGEIVRVEGNTSLEWAAKQRVNQVVRKGQFLFWAHLTSSGGERPSEKLPEDMVGVTIPVDPRLAVGEMLRIGDRVNLKGMLPLGAEGVTAVRIIEGVSVLAIGGRSPQERYYSGDEDPIDSAPEASRSYKSITIAVDEDVSLELDNVLSWVEGAVRLELVKSTSELGTRFPSPQLNPEVRKQFGQTAAPPKGFRM